MLFWTEENQVVLLDAVRQQPPPNDSENPRPTDVEGNRPAASNHHPTNSHENNDERRQSLVRCAVIALVP